MYRSIATLLIPLLLATGLSAARPPNVVILYADDLGVGDVSCYDAEDFETPNIDALAAGGVRLTEFYSAAPICAPARAALVTGRYPTRAGLSTQRNISSDLGVPGMATEEMTFAELLEPRGYATALFGKWHLGSSHDTQPNAQGFGLFYGHHASCVDPFSHWYYASEPYHHDLFRNREEVWEDGVHMTDIITRETTAFIKANRDRPFLIYAAYNTPHYPMVAHARFMKKYAHLPELRRLHVALVAGIDESIGRIMDQIRRSGLENNTLVFFASDNGVPNTSPRGEGGGSNGPYREYKRSLFDGGLRSPGIIHWPGTVPAGETRSQLAITMDIFATIAEVSGTDLPDDRVMDGRSWMPFIREPQAPGHDALFFEWFDQHAVRHGRWKVVRNGIIHIDTKGRYNHATGDEYIFLSDVTRDPGETRNLHAEHPGIAEELLQRHDAWRAEIAEDLAARGARSGDEDG